MVLVQIKSLDNIFIGMEKAAYSYGKKSKINHKKTFKRKSILKPMILLEKKSFQNSLYQHMCSVLVVESSRTQFDVLGLGLEGQVLSLEARKSSKMPGPRLEGSTIF